MLSKLIVLFQTLIYLRPVQIFNQIKNRLYRPRNLYLYGLTFKGPQSLKFFPISPVSQHLNIDGDTFYFTFLNRSKSFTRHLINWNEDQNGKLWNYNLQYLDYLRQTEIALSDKIHLIKDIYLWLWTGKLKLEPYPVSLRIMNIIRFLNSEQIELETKCEIQNWVVAELNYLSKNLEYHLLANHLLENAFAFWMGGLYFKNSSWIIKARNLLKNELKEQILSDGAHYELSPMYHRIILFRVLEAYHLTPEEDELKSVLKEIGKIMLGWMQQMCFADKTLPHFNDSTDGIAISPEILFDIAHQLKLKPKEVPFNASGYRVFNENALKLIADLEGIKPSYQPGHAHADTFSFVLSKGNKPIIVDPGISTYDIGPLRSWERSTKAHNTITIDKKNSSQVWSSFRVGKRAKVTMLEDTKEQVVAQHNGFGSEIHKRAFKIISNGIEIEDEIINRQTNSEIVARYYFAEDIIPKIINEKQVSLNTNVSITFTGAVNLSLEPCEIAKGFNLLVPSYCLTVKILGESLVIQFIHLY